MLASFLVAEAEHEGVLLLGALVVLGCLAARAGKLEHELSDKPPSRAAPRDDADDTSSTMMLWPLALF